jgi:hypothetical protein
MNWRSILTHRFVYVPAALSLLIAVWNSYIALNADGVIRGIVRDEAGRRVTGAEVIFFERNFVNYQEKARTMSDASGAFRFDNMQVHVGQLEARTADGRRSQREQLRLWFRAQHTEANPLVVRPPS